MFNQTAAYAMRALVYIAKHDEDQSVGAKGVASASDIPPNYLLKILRELVRRGLLKSTRGVGGGFRMAKPPEEIRVIDIVRPFDDLEQHVQCPWGYQHCEDQEPCPVDATWRPMAEAYTNFLENTTLADMLKCDK